MLFIVSSNVEKVDPTTRKLIRSHVMRGKKQRKGRPKDDTMPPKLMNTYDRTLVKLDEVVALYTPLVHGRVGSDLSFVQFPDEIDSLVVLHIAKFSAIAKRVIFPLIAAIGFRDHDDKEALYPIGTDAAVLHISAYAVEEFIDRVFRRPGDSTKPASMLHFQKGLRILRQRLIEGNEEEKLSNSTISAVVKLASAAHFDGDYRASKQHMEGLRKMLDLRGGLSTFEGKRILIEMLRTDLGIAILNCYPPVFFCQLSEQVPPYPEQLLSAPGEKTDPSTTKEWIQSLDEDLATAWRAMRRFCLLINLGTQIKRLISPEFIHDTMIAVVYRLLRMSFPASSIDEVVRLGLLAFTYHVFLQWQDIKLPYETLASIYRKCIMDLKAVDGTSPELIVWLSMTGANALFNVAEETWLTVVLRDSVRDCQVETWKEVLGILKSFMWIGLLDDESGKQIYSMLL